jgi:hypothetical protein
MSRIRAVWSGIPEGKRPLESPRLRWDYNIKIDLKLIRWDGVDWVYVAQGRCWWQATAEAKMNRRVP